MTNICYNHQGNKITLSKRFRKRFAYVRLTFDMNVQEPYFSNQIFGLLSVFDNRFETKLSEPFRKPSTFI